jgi:hypothetical protein
MIIQLLIYFLSDNTDVQLLLMLILLYSILFLHKQRS